MQKFLIFIILFTILLFFSIITIIKKTATNPFTKEVILNINNKISTNFKSEPLRPKINEKRVFEIDLTDNKIYFFENERLKRIIPIAYQSPFGVWYQTPTGYFRAGVKHKEHISSIRPVYMNYAVQIYEDFFIHEIPYYLDGRPVEGNFTGGCIRLEKHYAKEFFNLIKPGDLIVSYLTFKNLKIKNSFIPPVNYQEFFIRQRFNNPLRVTYSYSKNREIDYFQHSGIDLAPLPNAKDLNVYSIYDGKIIKIVLNGKEDHGLGNTVILEHQIGTTTIYSLYGHMEIINQNLKEGQFIKKGEILGKVGATGYGCNYWRIGMDGCDKTTKLDTHLHFELKTEPVLESPVEAKCNINGKIVKCYGYVPHNPTDFGYIDPLTFLFEKIY